MDLLWYCSEQSTAHTLMLHSMLCVETETATKQGKTYRNIQGYCILYEKDRPHISLYEVRYPAEAQAMLDLSGVGHCGLL